MIRASKTSELRELLSHDLSISNYIYPYSVDTMEAREVIFYAKILIRRKYND